MRTSRLRLALCVAIAVAAACSRPVAAPAATWTVLFGPVVSEETIVGRAVDGGVLWLATNGNSLVRVNLNARSHIRHAVKPLESGESIWGLGVRADGGVWTLIGRQTLAEIDDDGAIMRRIALAEPHVGLFDARPELIYQTLNFQPHTEALSAGPPGAAGRRPWSRMRTRQFSLARGAAASLNLVSCGTSEAGAIPCWFPDAPVITITDSHGASKEVVLAGLPAASPERILGLDHPMRPVRDVFTTSAGEIWVLGSFGPPQTDDERRGAPVLIRYSGRGEVLWRWELPEPARLILKAGVNHCTLLTWDGRIVEVSQ